MDKKKDLVVSFSGGETSAYMLKYCIETMKDFYNDMHIVFSNTGQENEETLVFVDKVSKLLGVDIVWLEAVVHEQKGLGTKHKITSFEEADREGKVFEDVIKKYGIPNQAYPHCTRELKLQPIKSYLRSLGLKKGDYDMAVGIRVDEIDRVSPTASKSDLIYPLVQNQPTTKVDVNTFWKNQPFRLNLKGYQGNCKWCWKKSFRKHYQLIKESPQIYSFPERMEELYSTNGANKDGKYKRVFFRSNKSTKDLINEALLADFDPPEDDSIVFNEYLDVGAGCEESCEVNFED